MLTTIPLAMLPALMICAGLTDLFSMTIPNRISLALALLFVPAALASGISVPVAVTHVGAGGLVLVVAFVLFSLGWIGGGDAKFAAATALCLGFYNLTEFVLLTALLGGGLTLALLSLRAVPLPMFALGWNWATRLHHPKTGIPYGIALASAGVWVYLHSPIWKAAF